MVEELYARAEGNPFFTEQLVAAALAGAAGSGLVVPAGLPGRLADLLAARAGRCAGEARAVLAGLAVAGRPLDEDQLGAVTGLDAETVREGLRELAAARMLADDPAAGGHRPRHALLAEAVASGLLAGERVALHERTARVLAAAGDQNLAGEVARHWQAAGRPAEELPARVAAAEAAERVFGYAHAAANWQRAIELAGMQPGAASLAGISAPRMYVRAIDTLYLSGDGERAGMVAEEAYQCFADDPDPAIAAVIRHRAAFHRAIDAPADALPLLEDALQLYERAPPSADHAMARLDHADVLLHFARGWNQPGVPALLNRALEIAEAAGAAAVIPRILAFSAEDAFVRGRIEDGSAFHERGWALARASQDIPALLWLAVSESSVQLKLAAFRRTAEVAVRGLGHARQAGLEASFSATVLAYNASEALLAQGRTGEAAALIDPLTAGPPDRLHRLVHEARAQIDLLRGDIDAATERRQLIDALFADAGNVEFTCESAPRAVELSLWAGRPGDALAAARRVLPLFKTPDMTLVCGRLLVAAMRACVDLAEQARARRDDSAAETAVAAADDLASWARQAPGPPFTDHPFVATISAERATWDAERTRLAGARDPQVWRGAAKAWQDLGCPHRAGSAWWRQAQAQLDAGQSAAAAAAALRAAAGAADGHAPLLVQVRLLAEPARIPLQPPAAAVTEAPLPAQAGAPYGLTGRELAVLRLLAAGRSNAQIGAELYISPSTASVHVSSILRKLGVSSRVQAAAIAERAGLLHREQP